MPEVVLVTSPQRDGTVAPGILAAAAIAGVDEVYRVGGPAVIGALAYGTESIRPVDVIVGPGSARVAQAKREVASAGLVGVPSAFAGPSEVVVVADAVDARSTGPPSTSCSRPSTAPTAWPGSSPGTRPWPTASPRPSPRSCRARRAASTSRPPWPRAATSVLCDGPEQAIEIANAIAPEHLELLVADPDALLPLVRHAGAVFCGAYAPASVGDYLAGPNHVLPTYGSARFSGALRVDDFLKHVHVVSVDQAALAEVGEHVIALATYEGLDAHAESIRRRQDRA